MADTTLLWWALLCAVSAVNVLAWAAAALWARRHAAGLPEATRRAIGWQLLLSAGYVLGCGYRSVFPVYDVGRQVLVDSWLSSVMMGRSVATVAELCFAAQWALLMHHVARDHDHRLGQRVASLVMPMIVTAEICSWHAVLTTSNLGHVVEETLWGLCAAALVTSLVLMWPRLHRELRPALATVVLMGVGYVIYMAQVDVPMYWGRWLAEADRGHAPLSLAQGVVDASTRWVVSHRWADWQAEVVWMTLYFSVAVWLSIALVRVPARLAASRQAMPAAQARFTLA